MNQQKPAVCLVCPEHVSWAADAGQTLVVNERNGTLFCLRGTEAAVWDWLAIGYPLARLADLLGSLLAVAPDEAERILAGLLSKWVASDLLEEVEEGRTAAAHG